MNWALVWQVTASIGSALLVYGAWARRPLLMWVGLFVAFGGAESLGVLWRATLSGHLWALYAIPLLGALVFAGSVWIAWHLGLEHVYAPSLKGGWWDDVALIVASFVAALIGIASAARRRVRAGR